MGAVGGVMMIGLGATLAAGGCRAQAEQPQITAGAYLRLVASVAICANCAASLCAW